MEYYDMEIPRRMSDAEYPMPSDLSVDFRFDRSAGGLMLSITSENLSLSYLGRGKICYRDGVIRLTSLSVIDPFLSARSFVPGKNLKIFLKAIYPKLLREKLPVSLNVTFSELPAVTISVTEVTADTVTCHIKWLEGGRDASPIDGMDGYLLAGNMICKGSPRFLSLVPKRTDGICIVKGDDAKQLGKLCDLAGYMFCGTQLNDLRILGRGLVPPRREAPTLTYEDLFPELSISEAAPPPREETPVPPAPIIKPVAKHYDGPSLVSIRMRASNRDMNTISARFAEDAIRFGAMTGTPCAYTPLRSYWPTYTGMTEQQKQYYLWFRTSFMAGETPKADISYIFIAVYELINHGLPPSEDNFRILMRYWTAYRAEFPRLDLYLPRWAADYILTNELDVSPSEILLAVPEAAVQFEELLDAFLNDAMADGLDKLPASLWKYFCGYDVTTGKLWQSEHRDAFESALRRVFAVLDTALRQSKNESLIAAYKPPAVHKEYTAFTGAVCARQYRRQVSISFHPITKSAKLHDLLGNSIKYVENALRTRYKLMGRLRVGTLPQSVRSLIDAAIDPKEAVPPPKPLVIDISRAAALEKASWDNTKKLLDAVEESGEPIENAEESLVNVPSQIADPAARTDTQEETSEETFFHLLSELQRNYLFALLDNAPQEELETLCMEAFSLPDAVADEINEVSTDYFGDIILESNVILDDYLDFLNQQREAYHA